MEAQMSYWIIQRTVQNEGAQALTRRGHMTRYTPARTYSTRSLCNRVYSPIGEQYVYTPRLKPRNGLSTITISSCAKFTMQDSSPSISFVL